MEGSEARQAPCEFSVTTNGQLGLSYTPTLIREGKNSRLEYRAELTDETGRSITYTFAHEFANRVEVYTPQGTSSDQVTAANAVDRTSTSEKAIVWCYEGGCDLTITGERFDGWYADATFTQKLSAAQTFRYVPTQAESRIYTKFRLPELKIQCHETVKNATYMNNVNTVDLTVDDYTGPVVVKAFCEQGGVVTAGAEQTVTVTSGNRITLPENIVFVPTQIGEVSYVIEVYLPDGTKIGTTTITNTITATKLTPKVRVYYDGMEFGAFYELFNPSRTSYSWYKYNRVSVDVSFSPELDYPVPLPETSLVQVAIRASSIEYLLGSIHMPSVDYDNYELDRVRDDDGNEYIIGENTYFGWTHDIIEGESQRFFHFRYASAELPQTACLFDMNSEFPLNFEGFGAYSQNLNTGETYKFVTDLEPPTACTAHLVGHRFIYCFFQNNITAAELNVTSLYQGSDLQIETNLDRIEFVNDVHSK